MDGGKLRMVAIGKTVYLSGDRTFWKKSGASSSMAKRMVGKYLKTNAANKDYADLLAFYDLRQLAENLLPPNGLQVAGPESLAGSRVITLRDDTGARYSVALDGPPYPVRLAGKDGTDAVALDFTEYGKPVSLTPPPAGQVIDVSQVG